MKSQKTNAFQLAIAGGVLVLVLVCATFAWFAVGDHAWVNPFEVGISSPDVPSQLNSIEYWEGEEWVVYNGGHLDILPGQTYTFRIKFTAREGDKISMSFNDISADLREPVSSSEEGTDSNEQPIVYTPVTKELMLSDVLWYTLNDEDGEFKQIRPYGSEDTSLTILPETVVDETCKESENSMQYTYVYQIRMDESAGNEYMGEKLSFALVVNLPKSETPEENGGAEG